MLQESSIPIETHMHICTQHRFNVRRARASLFIALRFLFSHPSRSLPFPVPHALSAALDESHLLLQCPIPPAGRSVRVGDIHLWALPS